MGGVLMTSWVLNRESMEVFTLGLAGETITRVASYIGVDDDDNPIAVEWNPTITDEGGGVYSYTYTPTSLGAHAWVGLSSPTGWDVEINFDVVESTVEGKKLWEIRSAVARLCDDWVELEATETSADTSVIIDALAGVENDEHFRGSELWFHSEQGSVANRGRKVRCTSSSRDDASLSLGPGLAIPPADGDVAFVFNIGGMGTRFRSSIW